MTNTTINNENNWDLVVKPKSNFFNLKFKEVWQYRDLIILFVKRDIIAIYKQTILGPLWFLVQPIFTTLLFTFTFSTSAKLSTDGIPPVLFYLIGQVFWHFFSECLNKTSNTFISNAGVFGKVYFPRLTVPIATFLSSLFKLLIQLILLVIVYIYYSIGNNTISFNWHLFIFIPIFILLLGVMSLSMGIIFSAITAKYRDFTFLLALSIQLLMFASCIVFPVSMYSEKIQYWLMYNPIVSYMEAIKYILCNKGYFSIYYLCFNTISVMILFVFAVLMFNSTEKKFMDTI